MAGEEDRYWEKRSGREEKEERREGKGTEIEEDGGRVEGGILENAFELKDAIVEVEAQVSAKPSNQSIHTRSSMLV